MMFFYLLVIFKVSALQYMGNNSGIYAIFIGIYEIIGLEKIYDVPDNISCMEIKKRI